MEFGFYQIKPVSSERKYTQVLLPWISFLIANTLNLSVFIVFSDSKSSLEALNGFKIELDMVLKIIFKKLHKLHKAGKVHVIEFCF